MVPILRSQKAGVNGSADCFQHPVATQCSRPGDVIRPRHISPAQLRQLAKQVDPRHTLGHVAAIQQPVAVSRQRTTNLRQRGGVVLQVVGVQRERTHVQAAAAAMPQQVNGIHAARCSLRQPIGHLRQAIAPAVQHHHFYPGAHARSQCLPVGHVIEHKRHFGAAVGERGLTRDEEGGCGVGSECGHVAVFKKLGAPKLGVDNSDLFGKRGRHGVASGN